MRDEWKTDLLKASSSHDKPLNGVNSAFSQGLTRGQKELERIPSRSMASQAMRLKMRPGNGDMARGISPRRQVGDAESLVHAPASTDDPGQVPWWRREGIEEGM